MSVKGEVRPLSNGAKSSQEQECRSTVVLRCFMTTKQKMKAKNEAVKLL